MDLARQRLRHQRLTGPPLGSPADVVRWLGAVQAQDYPGAKWALALRTRDASSDALDRAFNEGAFLRTHVLRPTWHLVAPEDIRWMLALSAPRIKRALASYDRKLELDGPTLARAHTLLVDALRDGRPRTRSELADTLATGGIEARSSRLAHLVMHAELDGLVCSGPLRGKQHTYVLFDTRVPAAPPRPREESLAALAQRYFASHGPATAHDFAWWAGLTVSDARQALHLLGPDVERTALGSKTYWTTATAPLPKAVEPTLHLLPNYDEFVGAYRDKAPSVYPGAMGVLDGWGTGRTPHLIVRDGLIVGGWRRSVREGRVELRLDLHVPLSLEERDALKSAAGAYGRHVGLPPHWSNTIS